MRATKLLLVFVVVFLIHHYADVEARRTARTKTSTSKSKSKSKVPSSSSSKSKTSIHSWGTDSSSTSSKKKSTSTKKVYTDAQKKIIKAKKDKRHKQSFDKFRKMKKKTQMDRGFGKSVMRADKTGGRLILQRRGQVFLMRVRDVSERSSNGTEVTNEDIKFKNQIYKLVTHYTIFILILLLSYIL